MRNTLFKNKNITKSWYWLIYTVIYRYFSRMSSFNGTSVAQYVYSIPGPTSGISGGDEISKIGSSKIGNNGNSSKINENTSNEYSNTNDNNSYLNRNTNSLLSSNKFSKNSTKENKDNTSLFQKLNTSVNLKRSATTY